MNECVKNNILNIEIYTEGGFPAKYTVTVYNACGENVAGAKLCGRNEEFVLPDGEYKIEVSGDAYSSPRMQQRWITICGQSPECHFGLNFIFGRIYASDNRCAEKKPDIHPCNPCRNESKQHCGGARHPCAPVQSPFMPSMYVKEWQKRNNIEYSGCAHTYSHSTHNNILSECGKYKPVPPPAKPPECKPAQKSSRGRKPCVHK
ncbi:MAG: hypothetical protein LBL98_07575 [Ruminococcus sp.]|jgi:hypothetical protein|nr:hypothetical protein [Ruminococcus sp.]